MDRLDDIFNILCSKDAEDSGLELTWKLLSELISVSKKVKNIGI